jgi:hypothetical protein
MNFDRQLKRGYLALMGSTLLAIAVVPTPEFSRNLRQLVLTDLATNACTANAKSDWRFASTPIDIRVLLTQQALICKA